MPGSLSLISAAFLIPLSIIISYYDVCYRRIPNSFVLATLTSGILVNAFYGGFRGALTSLLGCFIAFTLMFVLHVFGAMGAGDVKLFAAIGSLVGAHLVLPTFLVVALTGGVLGSSLRSRGPRQLKFTLMRVLQILIGLLPGYKIPRFPVPTDRRHTIPYGVAITFGSFLSLVIFRP